MFVTCVVRFSHGGDYALIIFSEFCQHVRWFDIGCIVIRKPLMARNVTDRAERRLADFAHTLGNDIRGCEYLIGLLVEQQVIVAKMWPAYMPMEILGLEIERKTVCEDAVERGGDIFRGIGP